MPETRTSAMDERDIADFHSHPEWFEARPLYGRGPATLALPEDAKRRLEVLDAIINPPVVIGRKPIPFVLPIRGSAL